jgi:hypothetical protein
MKSRRCVALLRNLSVVCLVTFISVTSVAAQTPGSSDAERGRLWGYAFAAPGLWFQSYCVEYEFKTVRCSRSSWTRPETMPHLGGGVEWQLFRSLGVSTEAGLVVLNGYAGGILSVNGSYYFRDAPAAEPSLVPFVTGGYSLDPDLSNGLNLGGGVTYWDAAVKVCGLKCEPTFWTYVRFLEFRIGMNFGRSSK